MIRHRTASAPSLRPRRTRRIARLCVESLETRALLSTIDTLGTILPAVASVIAAEGWNSPGQPTGAVTNPKPISSALTPSQLLTAYGFNKSSTAGAGTTIAIVDAYNDPNIKADLATFDAMYGLAAASLTVVNERGQTTGLPATSPDWSLEIALDVEWAHVVAPAAKIVLVEAASTSAGDLMTAVQTGARMANVVSMSWGGGEWTRHKTYDTAAYFANPNVTFVAASGDDGGAYGAEWPASSPDVLAVGGTKLSISTSAGTYGGETAWSASGSRWTGYQGSTGGVSKVESLPSYQSTALGANYASGRTVPDVSMDADPNSGVSVYSSVAGLSQSGWFQVGGTSAGSPIWAGLVATADQARAAAKLSALSSTQTLSLVYSLYGTTASKATSYATDFHDVTSGKNYAGYATVGYDMVTGLGSPIASAIVTAASHSSNATGTTTVIPSQTVIKVRKLVHRHAETETTTNVTASVVVVVTASQPNIAALTSAADATVGQSLAVPTAAIATNSVGRALPNQLESTVTTESFVTASSSGQQALTVYNESDVTPGATTAPAADPGRGDFPSPPLLNPTTPIEVWDEALAAYYKDEDADSSTEPQPFLPWTACEEAEDDLSDAGPCLLGAAGFAAVFWISWNRRLSQRDDDDRLFRPSIIPTPSDN